MFNEEGIEEFCTRLETITSEVGKRYDACTTLEEFEHFFEEIKGIDGVEEVYTSGETVFLKIQGWGAIAYLFPQDTDEMEVRSLAKEIEPMTRADYSIHDQLELMQVCIVNQQHEDESRQFVRDIVDFSESMFREYGYYVTVIRYPSLNFFRSELFKSDIVFMLTHGMYDEKTNLHWICTGEEHPENQTGNKDWYKEKNLFLYPEDQVSLGYVKETRDGKEVSVCYTTISEKYFSESDFSFRKEGKSIMFNTACHSLEKNHNFAEALIRKGLGCYLGYDDEDRVGRYAGVNFYGRLLSGMTIDSAVNHLPSWCKKDEDADLEIVFGDPSLGNSCLNRPVITLIEDQSQKNEVKVLLRGKCPLFYPDSFPTATLKEKYDFPYSKLGYGFIISETENYKEGRKTSDYSVGTAGCNLVSNECSFEVIVSGSDLKQDTHYYCWPFFFDGTDYSLGDAVEFTTNRINQVIPPEIREKMEEKIPIYEGINPPSVVGQYLLSPDELIEDTTGNFEAGSLFADLYFQFYNQDMENNVLDYREKQASSSSYGEGAFISGEGDNFSVFFNIEGVSEYSDYSVKYKTALIISGMKTISGIENLRYAFVLLEKSDDPSNHVMEVGGFRVFKDSDELCYPVSAFNSPGHSPSGVIHPYTSSPSLPARIDSDHVSVLH